MTSTYFTCSKEPTSFNSTSFGPEISTIPISETKGRVWKSFTSALKQTFPESLCETILSIAGFIPFFVLGLPAVKLLGCIWPNIQAHASLIGKHVTLKSGITVSAPFAYTKCDFILNAIGIILILGLIPATILTPSCLILYNIGESFISSFKKAYTEN